MNRVYVFIDAANMWQAQKARGRFFYYDAYPADGTRGYSLDGKHTFYTYLKKGLGFTVRKKELKRIRIETEDGESIKE